jgi:hypothetical protein
VFGVPPLPRGRLPLVFIDLGAQLRVQTDVGIQLWAPVYLLLTKLRLYEAPAHVPHGPDRCQEVALLEAQELPLRGVHEAHLPVDLVDKQVPDEAYALVFGAEDLAVDQVARRPSASR